MKKEVRGIHKKSIFGGLLLPAILGLLLYGLRMIPWVAEYVFARGITRWLTNFLTWLTNLAPFSVAEWILYLIPVGLLFSLIYCVMHGGFRHLFHWICGVLAILLWGICLFEVLFVIQFGRIRLEDQLGYETGHITAEELYESAVQMRDLAVQLSPQITYTEEGYSGWEEEQTLQDSNMAILAYSAQRNFEDVNRTLGLSLSTNSVRPKAIFASEPFSYTGILGIYIPFTGEANLNVAAPSFVVAVSAAHEQMHQKGYSREDEANFLSIQTCLSDKHVYMRYSGAVYAFRYLYNALYRVDRQLYTQLLQETPTQLLQELRYYNEWILAHENQVTSITQQVNNTYLKVSGGEGTVSYSQVVQLLVGAYRQQNLPEV